MTPKTTARIATEVFTANIHHATPISRTMENTQSRERRATANAAKEWEWSKNIRGRKEQMDKKEILDILDNAKDERGAVPMRLVRQAFDKLPTIQPEKAQLSQEDATSDLISRQAALKAINSWRGRFSEEYNEAIDDCENSIKELPTIQPEPKEGHWIEGGIYRDVIECHCSECGQLMTTAVTVRMNFCPNCGAKMKGVKHETD